jgi:hypothetical protein
MKYIALVVLLALTIGYAQAVPLQGGNGNATAVLFSAVRLPLASNETGLAGLELDLSLIGAEEARFELVDSKNAVYEPAFTGNLQHGRLLLIFKVPEYALFKQLKVTPSSGEPFSINWWDTPKGTKDDLVLRYYGVIDWLVTPGIKQEILYQISLFNSTSPIPVTLDNFTLLDQWGWPYTPSDIVMLTNGRINLTFTDISPLSSPRYLAYDYAGSGEILVDLENDLQQLSDEKVYGTNATQPVTPLQPAEVKQPPADIVSQNQTSQPETSTLKEDIAASKRRLENVTAEPTHTGPSSPSNMKTGIELAQERLEMMKKNR